MSAPINALSLGLDVDLATKSKDSKESKGKGISRQLETWIFSWANRKENGSTCLVDQSGAMAAPTNRDEEVEAWERIEGHAERGAVQGLTFPRLLALRCVLSSAYVPPHHTPCRLGSGRPVGGER